MENEEQIDGGTLSFQGLVSDARKALADGRAQVNADGTVTLGNRTVRAPRVANAIRFAATERGVFCSVCRGTHGSEIEHASE